MVPHVSLPMSSNVPTAAVVSSVPMLSMLSSPMLSIIFLLVTSASMLVSSAPIPARQSSPEPVVIGKQFAEPEPAAANNLTGEPMNTLLRERVARREAMFAERNEDFTARKNRVWESKASLSTVASTEATLRLHAATLQAQLSAASADLTAARAFAALPASALNKVCAKNERLTSWVAVVTTTVDEVHRKLATAQSPTFSAAFDSVCGERERY